MRSDYLDINMNIKSMNGERVYVKDCGMIEKCPDYMMSKRPCKSYNRSTLKSISIPDSICLANGIMNKVKCGGDSFFECFDEARKQGMAYCEFLYRRID